MRAARKTPPLPPSLKSPADVDEGGWVEGEGEEGRGPGGEQRRRYPAGGGREGAFT